MQINNSFFNSKSINSSKSQSPTFTSLNISGVKISADAFIPYNKLDIADIYSVLAEPYYKELHHYLSKIGYKPNPNTEKNIVLMGCGEAFEGSAVNSCLGGTKFGEFNDNVRIFGIDSDPCQISKARKVHEKFPKNFKFFVDDNLNMPNIAQIPKELDAVTFKNPYLYGDELPKYNTIIEQAYDALKKDGLIISSFYVRGEDLYFRNIMNDLGLKSATGDSPFIIIKKT